jgi:hypothetical protein
MWMMTYSNWKSRDQHCCALANAGKKLFPKLPGGGGLHRGFPIDIRKMKDDNKKKHRDIRNRFQSLYDVKQKGT